MTNLLNGFATQEEFAEAHDIHPRTVTRYRKQPNGLPWMEFGGKIYIDLDGARQWLARQVRSNARTRKSAAA